MAFPSPIGASRPERRPGAHRARRVDPDPREQVVWTGLKIAAVAIACTALIALSMMSIADVGRLTIEAGRRLVDRVVQPLHIPRLAQRSTIYASDGSTLGSIYLNYDRKAVPLTRVNGVTRKAVLAIEDERFYEHGALDLRGIVRAAVEDVRAGGIVQGGSTITQQLVKDTITGSALTLSRKLHEAIDAFRVERTYSKDRIFQMYLNEIYLGNGVYGMAAAAQFYFDEPVDELTLVQAALLAGMIESPTHDDPIAHPKIALARRDYVLARMAALGWIGESRYRHAFEAPIRLSAKGRDAAAPGPRSYWEQFVIQQFLADPRFGHTMRQREHLLFQGGLRIYTTLDPAMQKDAEIAIRNRMSGPGLPQSALASIVPQTGAIRAMAIGNWPFGRHRYNLTTDPGGGRSAGSAFKVFTLAAALEKGISPNAVYSGSSPRTIPTCGGGQTWTVHNAEPGAGSYPLWLATADSVNAVFAQVIDQVGPGKVAEVAHRMGITNPLVPVCPLTLGTSPVSPLQMTSAYSTLANGGIHCAPYAIAKVVTSGGEVLARAQPECARAIPADVAAEETAMLQNVIRFGTGTAAQIGRPEAGKTGTGDNYQDAWFVGYVPDLATGVWVGWAKAEIPMPSIPGYGEGFGGVLAAPIWHDFMLAATARMPPVDFLPAPIPIGGSGVSASPSPSTRPAAPATSPTVSSPGQGNGNGNGHGNGHGPRPARRLRR